MNIYLKFVLLLTFSFCAFASDNIEKQKLINKIQKQVSEAELLIEELGRDRIGDLYFQRLRESRITLAQFKSDPINNKSHVDEVNNLYFSLDSLLNPKNTEENESKQIKYKRLLQGNGIIHGVVSTTLSGERISGVEAKLYDSFGNYIRRVFTNDVGRYKFENLAGDQYIIIVYKPKYISMANSDIPCEGGIGVGCKLNDLVTISLEEDQVLGDVDFLISLFPTISGNIFNSADISEKIGAATIALYNSNGEYIKDVSSSTSSSTKGNYKIYIPDAGDYYLTAYHSSYNKQLYENIACSGDCDFNLGTLINISLNQQIESFDFAMVGASSISGTVIDSISNVPLLDGSVNFFDLEGLFVSSTSITENGGWLVENLPAGEYKIISKSSGYLATIYNQIGCMSAYYSTCPPETPLGDIFVHTDSGTNNLVLRQIKGARIKGRVLDSSGNPIYRARVYLLDENFELIVQTRNYSDSDGYYSTYAINNGNYYLMAHADDHQGELFPNILCHYWECDYTQGSLITINNLSDENNIDFVLNNFAQISGKVTQSNNPVQYTKVYIRGLSNSYFEYFYTNTLGEYTASYVSAGDYEVYVNEDDYYPEIYNNIHCDDIECLNETVAPISVTDNQLSGIDFTLDTLETLTFNLTSTTTNEVSTGKIEAYDAQGNLVQSYSVESNILIAAGDYYFLYTGNNFVPKVYGGVNCFDNCDPTTGNLIHIGTNSNKTLNMNLDEFFYLDFISTIGQVNYWLYNDDFTEYKSSYAQNHQRHIKDEGGKYLILRKSQYYSQVFAGINCYQDSCDITQGTLINPQLNTSVLIDIDDMLAREDSISGTITDPDGLALDNVRLEIYTNLSVNNSNSYTYTNENGEYTFTNKTVGIYYIKAIPPYTSNFDSTYYGDIACHINCEAMNIPAITLNIGEDLTGYDIQFLNKGSLTGESILDIDLQPIPSLLYVFEEGEFDSDNYVTFSGVNSDGTLSPMYLGSGKYKIVAASRVNVYSNTPDVFSAYSNKSCEYLSLAECAQRSQTIIITNGNNFHIDKFTVHRQGEIKGLISDIMSGNPINESEIGVYRVEDGTLYKTYESDSNGEYSIKLERGEYYLFFTGSQNRWSFNANISQLYNNIDCPRGLGLDCFFMSGDTVNVVDDGVMVLNINLQAKPILKVKLVNSISNELLEPSRIKVLDSNNNEEIFGNNGGFEQVNNTLIIKTLLPNIPYTIKDASYNYINQYISYPGIYCPPITPYLCEQQQSQTVTLLPGVDKDISLGVVIPSSINGYVKDNQTDLGIEDIFIDLWDNDGVYLGSTNTFLNGGFSISTLDASGNSLSENGNYYISTDTRNEFINEVYSNRQCNSAAIFGFCDLAQGELITVPLNSSVPVIIDIKLNIDLILINGFEQL